MCRCNEYYFVANAIQSIKSTIFPTNQLCSIDKEECRREFCNKNSSIRYNKYVEAVDNLLSFAFVECNQYEFSVGKSLKPIKISLV